MRKPLWIVPALLMVAAILAPCARADKVTFTCTGDNNDGSSTPPFYGPCFEAAPTAPNVTFPGPTLDITWYSQSFDITLTSTWQDTDSYSWLASNMGFFIFDGTHPFDPSVFASPINTNLPSGEGISEFGTLTFTPGSVGAPEPGTSALLLLGIGLVLVLAKRVAQVR